MTQGGQHRDMGLGAALSPRTPTSPWQGGGETLQWGWVLCSVEALPAVLWLCQEGEQEERDHWVMAGLC